MFLTAKNCLCNLQAKTPISTEFIELTYCANLNVLILCSKILQSFIIIQVQEIDIVR